MQRESGPEQELEDVPVGDERTAAASLWRIACVFACGAWFFYASRHALGGHLLKSLVGGLVIPPAEDPFTPILIPLALALGTVLGALGVGRLLPCRAPLPEDLSLAGRTALRGLAGASLLAVPLSVLAFAKLLSVSWALVGGFTLFEVVSLLRQCRKSESRPVRADALRWWMWLMMVVLLGALVVPALGPAMESDGLRYHLFTAQEWSRAGGFVYLPFNAHSNLPAQLSLLATPSWPWARVHPMLHAAHLIAALLLLGECARLLYRRLGGEPSGESMVRGAAMLCGMAVPVLVIVGTWPFSDVASLAMLLGALCVGLTKGGAGRCVLLWAGVLLGGCVATKLSNGPAAVLVGVFVFGLHWSDLGAGLKERGRALVLLTAAGLLPVAPWLLKNLLHTGNPFYPGLHGLLGGGEWTAEANAFYAAKAAEKGVPHTIGNFLTTPWKLVQEWHDLFEGHMVGAVWPALFLPAALSVLAAWRERTARMTWCAVAGLWLLIYTAWFFGYQSNRFLLPAAAVLVLWGVAGFGILALGKALRMVAFLLLMVPVTFGFSSVRHNYKDLRYPKEKTRLLGEESELLALRGTTSYRAFQWLNARFEDAPESPKVFFIGEHRGTYAANFVPVHSDWFDTPRILAELRATENNDELLLRWKNQGIRYVLFNWAELRMYSDAYFQPRFNPLEWARYQSLIQGVVVPRNIYPNAEVERVFVADLEKE